MMSLFRPLRSLIASLALWGACWCHAQPLTVRPYASFDLPGAATALAFSSTGDLLLTGTEDGRVRGWDLQQKEPLLEADAGATPVFLAWLPGDTAFVVVDRAGTVTVQSRQQAAPAATFETAARPARVALDAGRRYLAVATEAERIELFDLQAHARLGIIDARDEIDAFVFLGFDRAGSQLVALSNRGELVSWNPVTQQRLRQLALSGGELHSSRSKIHAAATRPTSHVFVVGLEEVALPRGGLRGRARPGDLVRRHLLIAYDWESGIEIRRLEVRQGAVTALALGPGSDHAAVAGREHTEVAIVDLRSGEPVRTITTEAPPRVLAVSEDDRFLAVGADTGPLSVWELRFDGASLEAEALPTLSGRTRVEGEQQPLITPASNITLAVLPFEARGVAEPVAQLMADHLSTSLANVEHLTLVERLRVDALLQEFELQEQGFTEADGLQIGRMLNADYVVLGSVGALGEQYTFSARMLQVETGRVVGGRQVVCEACRLEDLFEAMNLLGSTIAAPER